MLKRIEKIFSKYIMTIGISIIITIVTPITVAYAQLPNRNWDIHLQHEILRQSEEAARKMEQIAHSAGEAGQNALQAANQGVRDALEYSTIKAFKVTASRWASGIYVGDWNIGQQISGVYDVSSRIDAIHDAPDHFIGRQIFETNIPLYRALSDNQPWGADSRRHEQWTVQTSYSTHQPQTQAVQQMADVQRWQKQFQLYDEDSHRIMMEAWEAGRTAQELPLVVSPWIASAYKAGLDSAMEAAQFDNMLRHNQGQNPANWSEWSIPGTSSSEFRNPLQDYAQAAREVESAMRLHQQMEAITNFNQILPNNQFNNLNNSNWDHILDTGSLGN